MKKREQNKITAVNKICAGFFDLLQTKTLGEISMTDIANQIGMKRSTIYGYFGSVKEISDYLLDLNNKFCESYIEEHFEFLKENEFITEIHVKEALTPLFQKISEQPSHYYLIEKLDFTYLPILDTVREMIHRVVSQNNAEEQYIEYYKFAIKHAIYAIILQWLKNDAKDPVDDIVNIVIRILFVNI